MTESFLYPVDTDQFEKIRKRGMVYVDKTDFIYDLVSRYSYVFLARPRRFGKSLLCNTLRAYFEGKRELFEGLKIAELEKDWDSYPVLHFDMSQLRNCESIEEMKAVLDLMIARYENEYGTQKCIDYAGSRLSMLLQHIHKTTGKEVVVLIDEYDTPLMRNLYDTEKRESVRTLLRGLYQTLKIDGAHLRFVFLTGITKFSQLSIFSELNNLNNISMDDRYSGICGITQDELDTALRPCVEEFAEKVGVTIEEAYSLLKKQYDGYHFSENSKDVYAPFSLLRCLNEGKLKDYWFEVGTSSSLLEHLKHYSMKEVAEYDGIIASADQFNIPCEKAATPIPLLYQSGYLSIEKYNKRLEEFTLHFPNKEVRNGMINCLMPIVLKRPSFENDSLVRNFARAIYEGNLSQALLCMRAYIAGIPYDIITKEEWEDKQERERFYKQLMYLVFSILNSKVDTEVKSIMGRADVVIQTDEDVFVLELKVDDTVEHALAQIDSKDYAIQWSADGRRITKCGVSITSGKRNITHWRITDGMGNLVEDKVFDE